MNAINVRKFIQENYTPYDGDASFLAGPTERTTKLWNEVLELMKQGALRRRRAGLRHQDHFDITSPRSRLYRQRAGADRACRPISPLKRAIMPFGGIRVVRTPAWKNTAASLTRKWSASSNTARLTTTASLTYTPTKSRSPAATSSPHRPARRLRPRPHHRRLPPRGPVWWTFD